MLLDKRRVCETHGKPALPPQWLFKYTVI